MSKKLKILTSFLLIISLFTSIGVTEGFAVEDTSDQVVLLSEIGEEDEFGDSPTVTFEGEDLFSEVEIAGQSSNSIGDVRERVNNMSTATSSFSEEIDSNSYEDTLDITEIDEGTLQEVVLMASPSISVSSYTLCFSKGSTTTFYLTINNLNENAQLQWATSNKNICSFRSASINGNRISVVVDGNEVGDCALAFRLIRNGSVLTNSNRVEVSVLPAIHPSINVSSSSLNIAKNSRSTVTVSHNLPGANVYVGWEWSNNGVVNCGWGGWNSSKTSFPFYVDGRNAGNASIKLGLYNRFDQLLAYSYISPVKVYEVSNPSLTLSSTSINMYTGNTSRVRVTVSGMNGSWYLNVSYPNVCTAQWQKISNDVYDLYIGGNTPVSRSATIELKDSNDKVVKSTNLSITIISRASPSISVSKSTIDVATGSKDYVNIGISNCNEAAYLHPIRSSSAFGISWGDWNGSSVPCSIIGYSTPQNATLTIQLCRKSDNRVLDSKTISIRIVAASTPPMAYGFRNYSQPGIPLSTCQIIFGDGQRAKTVFNRDYGDGGVCFGMSTSSALLYYGIGNLSLRNFSGNFSTIHNMTNNLDRTNPYNSTVKLNLKQIIEAMHVSQYSSHYSYTTGVGSVAKKITSELNQGRVVAVGIRGDYNGESNCGHLVLAYGYSLPNSREMIAKIYDPNKPDMMSTISFKRTSDTGDYTSWYFANLDWGTGKPNASINCIALDSISYIWNNRGNWILRLFSDDEPEHEHLNLLVTSEKSFELYAYDVENPMSDGILVLKCENGEISFIGNGVTHVDNWGILPDGTAEQSDLMFYLPVDYYTFKDLSLEDGVEAVLSDDDYSVTVSTDAHVFDFYAEDTTSTVGALISANSGDVYQISIGSSVEGEPDSYNYSGTGFGGFVSVALENGELTSGGVTGASVSITTDEAARYYSIYDEHTAGGSVFYADGKHTDLAEGDSCLAQFIPDEGYLVFNVNIDGVNYGGIESYTFDDITGNHQIYADFRRDISECSVTFLGYDEANEPIFSLKNSDGEVLTAFDDYSYSRLADESRIIAFLAAENSSYTGVLIYTMDELRDTITHCSVDDNKLVSVNLSAVVPDSKVIVAFYDDDGRMFAVLTKDSNSDVLSFDFSSTTFPPTYHGAVFWVDESFKPICEKYVI